MAACCFCERTDDQVTHLIQGPKLFVCDICVDACVDTLATKDRGWRERQIDYLEIAAQAGADCTASWKSKLRH